MTEYGSEQIAVLKGLEGVRRRPGMYITGTGIDGLHHLLWEIVDNSVDEAMNGHASRVVVTLHEGGTGVTVEDNGRGIPVEEHPTEKVSALQVVLTTLHAGGKFGGDSYKTSGGLHGVGSSVVNALSVHLRAEIKRNGRLYVQEYRRGVPRGPVDDVGPAKGTGTTITFEPDPEIFAETTFDAAIIRERLEQRAYLHKGLRIVFRDRVQGQTWDLAHDRGLADWLAASTQDEGRKPILDAPFLLDRDAGDHRLELALTWTEAPAESWRTFVNGIPTRDGGTHEQGLKDAVTRAVRNFADAHGLTPRNLALAAEDLREGVFAILSFYTREPQFQGQTKERLNNPEARGQVDGAVRATLEQWLHDHRARGEAIVARAVQAAKARLASREAATEVRRKSATSGRMSLPGKLADCSSSDAGRTELFIVEGDSAGGSAKQGRDRRFQAILPLRGKVLNAEQAHVKKVLENEELSNIVTALGCGLGTDFRADRLRYGRVILLMDADSDGHHITTLLLTFFFRYLRPLVEGGYVYLAQPPLYRVVVGKQSYWAADDAERDRLLAEHPARARPEITRFKGLGEMPPKTLFETTLDPRTRRLLQITVPDMDASILALEHLMGKDPGPRYRFLMEEAASLRDASALDV